MNNTVTSEASGTGNQTKPVDDRRRYTRGGLFSRLEDITYAVLRGCQSRLTIDPNDREEVDMHNNLEIVTRNSNVLRIATQKQTWLIHRSDGTTRAIDVDHGQDGAPIVIAQLQVVG